MILFRCDASPTLGVGHLVRSRALASAFKARGVNCIMVGPALTYKISSDADLFDEWFPCGQWRSSVDEALEICDLVQRFNIKACVIDDYRADHSFQLTLRKNAIRWLQFESNPRNALLPDWVLYANPNAQRMRWATSSKHSPKYFLGPKYAILRREFWNIDHRSANVTRSGRVNLLCAFGGGDDLGAIRYVVDELSGLTGDRLNLTVISGADNPRNLDHLTYLDRRLGVRLLIDPPSVAQVMLDTDLAITSGGTLTYELAACRVPMLILALAENQVAASAWEDIGCAAYLGRFREVRTEQIRRSVRGILNNSDRIGDMKRSLSKVDCGSGLSCVVDFVIREVE